VLKREREIRRGGGMEEEGGREEHSLKHVKGKD